MNEDHYAKLDQRIVYSSMWEEDGDTCKVWVTLLALKSLQTGVVDKNITGIARLCNLPLIKVEEAFTKFMSPDPKSSSPDYEGRRLLQVPTGYFVVNHEKYTTLGWSEEKKAYERQRKAAQRARKNGAKEPPKKDPDAVPSNKQKAADLSREDATTLLELMNQLSGAKLREVDSNLDPIVKRLKEGGVDMDGCAKMLRRQWELWKDSFTTDHKPMREYFTPSTIFKTYKFDNYYSARDLPITTKQHKPSVPFPDQVINVPEIK